MKVATKELIEKKEFPAVSIILPTHPKYPDYKLDQAHMQEVIQKVETRLRKQYSPEQSAAIVEKLTGAASRIDFSKLSEGLAIYISPNVEKVIHLPFPVSSEKVIVDESFEVRDLIQLMKSCRNCLLVVVSQNKVRTYLGFECQLSPVTFLDMPENVNDVTNEHSLPGWDYFDSKSWDEKNLHNYLHFINKAIEKELNHRKLDVIMIGDRKLLGYFRKQTTIENKIIGYVEGNYDRASIDELETVIQPVLAKETRKEEEYAMRLLSEAIDKDNYAVGISQVWRAAAEGRGRLLIVEKDYRQPATYGADSYTIHLDTESSNPWNIVADAVDDIMQKVLINKGDIVFVENGKLTDYQKIVLINRY
jgi:hypothetical protein